MPSLEFGYTTGARTECVCVYSRLCMNGSELLAALLLALFVACEFACKRSSLQWSEQTARAHGLRLIAELTNAAPALLQLAIAL